MTNDQLQKNDENGSLPDKAEKYHVDNFVSANNSTRISVAISKQT